MPEPSASSEKPKAILVVEDDKFLRELISKRLRDEKFTVFEAIDG